MRTLILSSFALIGMAIVAFAEDSIDRDKLRDELLGIAKRTPACLRDSNGLPQRVVITRNGTELFAEPKEGAKSIRSVGLYDRLYLYVKDPGTGFHRVGLDPWDESPTGWVPASFCLAWDNNEILFLNGDSVPTDVDRLFVWASEEDAREGKPEKAVYEEVVDRERAKVGDLFFPVLKKDRSETLYQIGFLFGGDQGGRDRFGKPLTEADKQRISENVLVINVVIVIDATGSMTPYIEEVKRQATKIVDELQDKALLTELGSELPIKLTVKFSLVAYRDKGDEFEVKTFVPLTNDVTTIQREIASLSATGGGDRPEMVVPAVRHVLTTLPLEQGALNRIILIGDAPPHELDKEILSGLGREAKSKYIAVDSLICGDDQETQASFDIIATSSGGTARKIDESSKLVRMIVEELKARAVGIPVEKELLQQSFTKKQSIQSSARELGLNDNQARRMMKFLTARGADIVSEQGLRQGWVRVRPGSDSRLRLYVYLPRWKLALQLSQLLNLSDSTEVKKKAENAIAVVQQLLGFTAGDKSGAGMSKDGTSAAKRGESVPELSPVTKKGPSAVITENPRVREKIQTLLRYWNNADAWEHDHVWIPVDALP